MECGKNMKRKAHKSNCPCCVCKIKRGDSHDLNCNCMACRMSRGETKGVNNPFYNKHHTLKTKQKISLNSSKNRKPRRLRRGYVYIYKPEHPFTVENRCIFEHHLVMEDWLRKHFPNSKYLIEVNGIKYFNQKFIIHHKNQIKHDNRIENLQIFNNISEHISEHNKLRKGETRRRINKLKTKI
jgi:hypothetical protein